MNESSAETLARARKNEKAILQSLASLGQVGVSVAMGVSESTVSRMKDGDITRLALFLAACGLKAVSVGMRCYEPKDIEHLLHFAKQRMAQLDSPEQLEFDE